ncbi:MAG: response regulator, partial [Alphaproteobacteria bacterium]|nr:response regulator [Alphaproteobacteria bacterium]
MKNLARGEKLTYERDLGPGAEAPPPAAEVPWTILIVDDDKEVHEITRVVLADCSFKGRPLLLRSAYSAAEAEAMLRRHPEIAVILLDMVMETEIAGLELVQKIREEFGNHRVRVILRTGQPGQAPERSIIMDYDINDYKAKTELTSQRLFTGI